MLKPPVLFLMGPTGSGKTDLAVSLAERLPLDVISVDSAMVYRGMDIGTAKPSSEVRRRVPHQLIDVADPTDRYSAAQFRAAALASIQRSIANGRIPLLTGGTMLYFRALRDGLAELPEAQPELRLSLQHTARTRGPAFMHQWLTQVDATAAARIAVNDPQRVQRALEVFVSSGVSLSQWIARSDTQQPLTAICDCRLVQFWIGPHARRALDAQLHQRFLSMLDQGLIDEVRGLGAVDVDPTLPSMKSVGYRQVLQYLRGELDNDEMIAQAVRATRMLAKRQYTWLRHWPHAKWLETQQSDDAFARLESALQYLRSVAIVI